MAREEPELADLSSFITGEWSAPVPVSYNRRDLLLYAVGIGCGQAGNAHYNDLRYVYEQEPGYVAFPTFPVSLAMKGNTEDDDTPASSDVYLGKVAATQGPFKSPEAGQPRMKIKGVKVGVDYERYIVKIQDVPPTGAKLFLRSRLYGVTQKKRGAVIETEEELFGEDGTVYYKFIGAGFSIGGHGFKDAGRSNAQDIDPPKRNPDFVDEVQISERAHLIYRLCGDYNPLHVDPAFPGVKAGGFPEPILMGLCTLGHVARSVLNTCAGGDAARFRALKVRFASPVLPGQTLVTQMWNESDRIVFVTKVKETGKVVISNSFMELNPPSAKL